ncbi:hypothetical protein [Polaribacter sp. IC073]|uniref:hypothetical protein n=1 Tax=Polaribacter sp. IC073 TaxID=2508540 RepID=UPI0011BE3F08|nr:hypothetical protein [Polaribacter sp. IC073]TXD45892.1 hypothetical protein ES045_15825 [Polaribacter sp. IC073]
MNTSYRQEAIQEVISSGVEITGKQFNRFLRSYNSGAMPLNNLNKRIAEKEEPLFIEYVKESVEKENHLNY